MRHVDLVMSIQRRNSGALKLIVTILTAVITTNTFEYKILSDEFDFLFVSEILVG